MKKMYKLGVIGCGVMATAILRGAVLSEFIRPKKVAVCDIDEKKLQSVEELDVQTFTDARYVAENSEFVLFAVKPQNFDELASTLQGICPERVISIMAGVKKNTIKNALGVGVRVARCMPNLPCTIGSGMMGVDVTDFNSRQDDSEFIFNLFGNMGDVLSVTEDKMNAITGISGSGPAYVFMFIDALVDAGVANGLTKDEAKRLAVQTVLGSAEMVQREDDTLSNLLMKVCSKGGTTIEAIKSFEKNNLRGTIAEGVSACVRRADELSK